MLAAFEKHIEQEFPELLQNHFLLACSGGLDSVALAHLFHSLKMDYSIAHCNFRLRGLESDGDEEFTRVLANKINKLYFVTHFDTMSYVNKNKVSVQVAARELRYRWFAEIMQQNTIKTLVTAHHGDDNLETFIINLSRGTGIDGLTGIPAKNESIARPLLKFSKEEIQEYAKIEGLAWREDSSNAETKYLRNKIRHHIVPMLKELHPTFLKNFVHTQEFLGQTSAILKNHIHELQENLFERDGTIIRINIKKIKGLNPVEAYLYELFRDFGFTEWNDMEMLLSAMSGKEIRSSTHRLVKDREYLILSEIVLGNSETAHIQEHDKTLKFPIALTIQEAYEIGKTEPGILYVDKETLNYPLVLRKWVKGDYFYPLGMKGKKKLSKFFKDEKVDVISKTEQWLLCSENNIVWVVGRRADERFKVSKVTKTILKFEFNP